MSGISTWGTTRGNDGSMMVIDGLGASGAGVEVHLVRGGGASGAGCIWCGGASGAGSGHTK